MWRRQKKTGLNFICLKSNHSELLPKKDRMNRESLSHPKYCRGLFPVSSQTWDLFGDLCCNWSQAFQATAHGISEVQLLSWTSAAWLQSLPGNFYAVWLTPWPHLTLNQPKSICWHKLRLEIGAIHCARHHSGTKLDGAISINWC